MKPVRKEMNEVYEDKLTSLTQALEGEKKRRKENEDINRKHLQQIQHLEEIIKDCNKECDTIFDQLSTKVNAIPEIIQQAIKPVEKMAAEAVKDCESEKMKRIRVEELLEKVTGERNVFAKENDGLNRCIFNMECKMKELEVNGAYQKDAIEDLKRKLAEQDERYEKCKQQTISFTTVLRKKCDGITKVLRNNFFCKIFPRKVSKKKLKVAAAIEEVEELLQLHAAEIQKF